MVQFDPSVQAVLRNALLGEVLVYGNRLRQIVKSLRADTVSKTALRGNDGADNAPFSSTHV